MAGGGRHVVKGAEGGGACDENEGGVTRDWERESLCMDIHIDP